MRCLHVYTNKIALLTRMLYQALHDANGKLPIDIEAHVCELQTDICIEPSFVNAVEQFVIKLRALSSLIRIGDVLAEVIEAHAHAVSICLLRGF